MRSALAIIPLFALAHLGLADLDWNDIPNTCRDECTPVINAFTDCARQVGTDTSVDFFRNGKVEVNNGRVEVDLPGPDGPNDNGPGRGRDNNNDANDRIDQAAEQRYAECVCNKPNASTDIPNCSNCLVQNGYRDKEAGDFARYCNFTTGAAPPPNTTASPTSTFTTTNAAGSTILSTLAPTPTFSPTGTLNNNQPVQATGAASKFGAQNVLVAAALVGLPAVL
ncbi:uncharacterized protein BKA78DRAFT_349209 [Phyllosticta capitalensis]|uniref:uncharacterized protein n=1 Tax=Phyllosticta capitalensis TaxID=121624 RepID=UPI003130BD51